MPQSLRKIFVVKNRALGDGIMGLGGIQYLKEQLPKAEVVYGLPSWIAPLFADVSSVADRVIPVNFKTISGWWKLNSFLRKEKFDFIYEMHQSGSSAKFFKFFSLMTGTPYAFSNHHQSLPERIPAIQRDLNGIHLALTPFGWKGNAPSYFKYCPQIDLARRSDSGTVVFGIVATRRTKVWPLEYYAKLAQKLVNEAGVKKILVPYGPSSLDQELVNKLKEMELSIEWEFINVSLKELPAKLAKAAYYIGNDTGIKHLCVAMGMKTFTFFGPEEPIEWHPYSDQTHPYFFIPELECRTKVSHYCALSECDSMICLNQIEVKQVFDQFLREAKKEN